jgi:hypothetical protein
MVVGELPSIFSVDDLMFLLAWAYEMRAASLQAAGDVAGAAAAQDSASAGYRDVYGESGGVVLRGENDRRWVAWRADDSMWLQRAQRFAHAGDDVLACLAFREAIRLRLARHTPEGVSSAAAAAGDVDEWSGEQQLWLMASRCAVRTGGCY